jgi:hypothetical protein
MIWDPSTLARLSAPGFTRALGTGDVVPYWPPQSTGGVSGAGEAAPGPSFDPNAALAATGPTGFSIPNSPINFLSMLTPLINQAIAAQQAASIPSGQGNAQAQPPAQAVPGTSSTDLSSQISAGGVPIAGSGAVPGSASQPAGMDTGAGAPNTGMSMPSGGVGSSDSSGGGGAPGEDGSGPGPGGDAGAAECFPGPVQVIMGDGSQRAIQSVRPGDLVQCRDWDSGATLSRPVKKKWSFMVPSDRVKQINGLRVTEQHRFATGIDQWRRCQDLQVGDQVLGADGDLIQIDRAEASAPAFVYNLEVEEHPNFVVSDGKHRYVVHNGGGGAK